MDSDFLPSIRPSSRTESILIAAIRTLVLIMAIKTCLLDVLVEGI
jgi:hypothetical protein